MKWQIRLSSFSLFINNIRENILVNIPAYFRPCMYRIMSLKKHCLKGFGQYFKLWYMLTNFSSLQRHQSWILGSQSVWIGVGVHWLWVGYVTVSPTWLSSAFFPAVSVVVESVCLTIINIACYFLKWTSQLQKVLGTKSITADPGQLLSFLLPWNKSIFIPPPFFDGAVSEIQCLPF